MRNMKYRSFILYIVIIAFLGGMGLFVYEFITQAEKWAFSSINRHLSEGTMSGGKIFDINDEVLAYTQNGKRIYHKDEQTRMAMLHVVGDGSVLIPTCVQNKYRNELFGYNAVTGFGAPSIFNSSQNIKLTLNSKVCAAVSKNFKGKKGTAIAYNYLTGEIICMISLPTYDVNKKPDDQALETENYNGVYLNRAISASYTPGSIFKVLTAIAAIDYLDNVGSESFFCDKLKIINGEKITCMHKHGKLDLKNALAKSCDIAFGDLAIKIGKEKMMTKMEHLGFNKQQYLDVIPLAKSNYNVKDASQADLGWSGIGQYTDSVNPLHMVKIMGAIANGGTSIEPRMIHSVLSDATSEIIKFPKQSSENLINPSTAEAVKQLMRYTVQSKYGDSLFGNIPMCAKTGTAEVGQDKQPNSWMVGFSYDKTFPIAFATIVEEGGFGIKTAGPISAAMIKSIRSNFKQ